MPSQTLHIVKLHVTKLPLNPPTRAIFFFFCWAHASLIDVRDAWKFSRTQQERSHKFSWSWHTCQRLWNCGLTMYCTHPFHTTHSLRHPNTHKSYAFAAFTLNFQNHHKLYVSDTDKNGTFSDFRTSSTGTYIHTHASNNARLQPCHLIILNSKSLINPACWSEMIYCRPTG